MSSKVFAFITSPHPEKKKYNNNPSPYALPILFKHLHNTWLKYFKELSTDFKV